MKEEAILGASAQHLKRENFVQEYLVPWYPASLIAQLVKNPPAMKDTLVWSLGWEKSPGEGNS